MMGNGSVLRSFTLAVRRAKRVKKGNEWTCFTCLALWTYL